MIITIEMPTLWCKCLRRYARKYLYQTMLTFYLELESLRQAHSHSSTDKITNIFPQAVPGEGMEISKSYNSTAETLVWSQRKHACGVETGKRPYHCPA